MDYYTMQDLMSRGCPRYAIKKIFGQPDKRIENSVGGPKKCLYLRKRIDELWSDDTLARIQEERDQFRVRLAKKMPA